TWFVRRRALASTVLPLAQAAGLVAMPLVAQIAIGAEGWRAGWLAIGAITLLVGFVPIWLFLARRPEDLGLLPDGAAGPAAPDAASGPIGARGRDGIAEPAYSRRQAVGTGAFWLLLLYTVLVYPVQAGISLHQAPFLIERGIAPTIAATIVSTFSLTSALATLACGVLPRAVSIQYKLALTGAILTLGVLLLLGVETALQGYIAAGVFGFGIGAILTLLPIAWADYFGRAHFGAIRGIALPAQVLAQAVGPVLSGALHDLTGNYTLSLQCFLALAGLSVVAAAAARPPDPAIPVPGNTHPKGAAANG
ncbi:MAG: hypothetical protein AB7T18_06365, partial [Alphaproteobacteria bacterium]